MTNYGDCQTGGAHVRTVLVISGDARDEEAERS